MAVIVDSLQKRYAYKILTVSVGVLISVATAGLIPRAIGAENYGNFSFLTQFFIGLLAFIDAGMTMNFFAKLSANKEEKALIHFYWLFIFCIGLLIIFFISSINTIGLTEFILPGQQGVYILLACIYALLTWYSGVANKIIDAFGLTVKGEKQQILQKVLMGVALVLMYYSTTLTLASLFVYHISLHLILILLWAVVMRKQGYTLFAPMRLPFSHYKSYSTTFLVFSLPIIISAGVGFLSAFGERWILQVVNGSTQQGYYAFGEYIAGLCFIPAGNMTALLTRDYAVETAEGNTVRAQQIIDRYFSMMFAITAVISAFVAFNVDAFIAILGGSGFKGTTWVLVFMLVSTVYRVYAQYCSALLLALQKSVLYAWFGGISAVVGIVLTALFVLPGEYFGFSLGAEGLSAKSLIISVVGANIMLFLTLRIIGIDYYKYLLHQLVLLVLLLVLNAITFLIPDVGAISRFLNLDSMLAATIIQIVLRGSVYLIGVLTAFFSLPWLFGISHETKMRYIQLAIEKLAKKTENR